jgi:hypothetical protein
MNNQLKLQEIIKAKDRLNLLEEQYEYYDVAEELEIARSVLQEIELD